MSWKIMGGHVLRAGALGAGEVALADGRITGELPAARRFDAKGLLVMPGIVDIHGDAHERALQPRPNVDFPAGFALRDAAAQCLAAGITTAYLGVTLSWEPGLRSLPAFLSTLEALKTPPPGPELRVHLRFEADNFGAEADAVAAIAAGRVHLLGFNDHTPSIVKKLKNPKELGKYAGRAGVSEAELMALADAAFSRRAEVPAMRERMAEAAKRAGIPMLSHDDATLGDRALFRGLGASICEFPMAEPVAEDARAAGEAVVMGAPNVVRGGSHLGWASAAPLAERGLVTVLASDYHWPALLAAPFRMAARGVLDLAAAWALVSSNPADALGLTDRGRIAEGLRGDIAVVTPEGALAACFVQGELAWIGPEFASRLH
ncbi:alpha-D-ribose 1-methylphosphonate 5-triphosphate diphosphatase [Roseococcus sp. SDR]|uniref:alpha-D-ribose 1-methylphosphonate 5-triphosphate diphosphatase n=1 Tax=Roseococcus sp. SDR TaxID=2835532 RepID=UPI001BCDB498|nr:alpha-D-ribose 1-methylphosphonate 5-triphosphate diphosphatase [Roseococcus sp. SDR]MBS7789507.1 alpha-D-ribose 1-methylphosphonate 5-triphosphate diphosphatase [Roseococcus sp. SDR]MBV1844821.1 alpha-D-ribose 1-methylphosphonate 5-triphosphate diphosphatase [Roseococcus sp. SDR]